MTKKIYIKDDKTWKDNRETTKKFF